MHEINKYIKCIGLLFEAQPQQSEQVWLGENHLTYVNLRIPHLQMGIKTAILKTMWELAQEPLYVISGTIIHLQQMGESNRVLLFLYFPATQLLVS